MRECVTCMYSYSYLYNLFDLDGCVLVIKNAIPCAKMSKTRLVPEPVGINSAAPSIPHNP